MFRCRFSNALIVRLNARLIVAVVVLVGWGLAASTASFVGGAFAGESESNEPEAKLARIDPLGVDQALQAFDVAPGYRVELVAAEPLVVDPVAFCFDAQGRLIVVEMRGYSERPDDHLGRVRRLTDDDGDGRMDRVETLIEGLSWPTAVECWRGGVVIAVAPSLIFLPENYQAGETPQILSTGFGRSNVQGLVNSLRWGLDLRLHGATSSSNGQMSNGQKGSGQMGMGPRDEVLRLGARDFAFDPLTKRIEVVDGGGQHGMMIDPWGDKYVCSNSDHLQQVMMVTPRVDRASRYASVPTMRRSIAADGPQADVFRASPVEPWRILRTQLRVSGKVPGPIEGGGRAAGYFTGATGVYVYDGDQWGDSSEPVALVCDVGSNLVHRKRMIEDGLWRRGERLDVNDEFLRSTDIWFRPVQLGTGPDGALYVCDMYREVIEHPLSLPPVIKSQLDLNSGNDRGRIWRVVQTDRPLRRETANLKSLSIVELVKQVDHANAWHRRTAARLLMEQQSPASIEPLRGIVLEGKLAEGRLQSLATLARIAGGLDREIIDQALKDEHPRVRQRALEIAASSPSVFGGLREEQCDTLAEDKSLHVRFQLVHDASTLIVNDAKRSQVLAAIARRDPADPWIRWGIEGSLGSATGMFAGIIRESAEAIPEHVKGDWQRSIAVQCIHHANSQSLQELTRMLDTGLEETAMESVANTIQSVSPDTLTAIRDWILKQTNHELLLELAVAESATKQIAAKLRLLLWASPERAYELLAEILKPNFPAMMQQVALANLTANDVKTVEMVLASLPSLTPLAQQAAFETLGGRREGQRMIAVEVRSGRLSGDVLPVELQRQLREHPDEAFHIPTTNRAVSNEPEISAEIVSSYNAALAGEPDIANGQAVFKRVCATCHRVGEEGRMVGPDLKSLVDKSPEQILLSVLDPNREVDPKYRVVQVETTDGRIVAGVVASETLFNLQMVDSQGNNHDLHREEIQSLRTQNRSFMPSGLEKEITAEQMRDLIGFLKAKSVQVRVGVFEINVSPPIGSPLAYDPCIEVTDPLMCKGIVLTGAGPPIVICSVDWLGIANESHRIWRERLAEAVGTSVERVALHTLHQHDAPRCDLSAAALLAEVGDAHTHYDVPWIRDCITRSAQAARDSTGAMEVVDSVGYGSAEVYEVASNRRLLGADGKVIATRYTACADPALRAYPVGTIDPMVRSISLWNGEHPLVVLTYYATHPQSYYRTGQANPDFPGYARNQRQTVTGIPHIHLNGAGGNIGAGKWNDGAKANRQVLSDRVADGMRRAWEGTTRLGIQASDIGWRVERVVLPIAEHLNDGDLDAIVHRTEATRPERVGAAEDLAWLRRSQAGERMDLQRLSIGPVRVLHMPGELFVEYQLAAAAMRPDLFVAMAAYGDYGPGYIGTQVAYGEGGYETSSHASRVAPEVEQVLTDAMQRLLVD